MTQTTNFPEPKRKPHFALRLLRKVIPYKTQTVLLFVITALASFLIIAPPLLIQFAIDQYILEKDLPGLVLILVAFVLLGLFIAGSGYLQRRMSEYVGSNVVRNIRDELFEHITCLPFSYFDTTSTGDIMARVTSDTNALTHFLNLTMITFVINVFMLLGILGVMFAWNVLFGVTFLALFPPILIALHLFKRKFLPAKREILRTNSLLTSSTQECFNGIREVKLYGREEFMEKTFQKWNDGNFNANVQTIKYQTILRPYVATILNVFSAIFIMIGSNLIIGNVLTLGEIIAALTYFTMIGSRIVYLIMFSDTYYNAKAASERIFDVLDKIPSITDSPDAIPFEHARGMIEFRDVHFGYDLPNEILKGISLKMRPGERIALVGPSGVGKTTLVHLIPRFYEVSRGELLVDGVNVNQYLLKSLRRNVGIVMQNVFLFDGTVAENIAYGQPDATPEEIQEAARVAQLDDEIQELPLKYNTPIGERGVKLSGGQAQRLAIARVLITNPKILIMDEPTANVDANTDQKVIQSLRQVMLGRTTIIIAHRLWTVKNADQIVLLKEGNIEAIGNHQELMTTSRFYREFFASQFMAGSSVDQNSAGDPKRETLNRDGREDTRHERAGRFRDGDGTSGRNNGGSGSSEMLASGISINREESASLKGGHLRFLYPYIKSHWWSIVQGILWTLVTTMVGLIPPLLLKTILDVYIPTANMIAILQYATILIGLYVANYFSRVAQNWVTGVTSQRIIRNLRVSIFRRFIRAPMRYFEQNKRGELVSVVTHDVSYLNSAVSSGLSNLFSAVFSVILLTVVMITLDWPLGLVASACMPIMLISISWYRRKIWKNDYEIQQKIAQMNANVEENISGVRVTQSLAMEQRSAKGFNQISRQLSELRTKSVKMFAKMNAVVSTFTYLLTAVIIAFGGYRYITGVSIGVIVAFIQYTNQINNPINDLLLLSDTFIHASTALQHIRELMMIPPVIPEPDHPIPLPGDVRGEITLNKVYFSYTDQPLYENLSLTIAAHEKLGIVGETGAGKTTLINLITRLYDVKAGSVRIDGIDVRSLRQQDLRSLIAIVSQDVFLFSDTIFNNIKFGRPTATEEEVYEAARIARADIFIQHQTRGYETKLGDQGAGVSGGQRQLLAYARLLIARPKIAILDEATSNIDSYTENLIQQNMDLAMKGSTVLIIAHRFATLKRVDRIILLSNAAIKALGTHDELMQSSEYYRELCEKQYSKF